VGKQDAKRFCRTSPRLTGSAPATAAQATTSAPTRNFMRTPPECTCTPRADTQIVPHGQLPAFIRAWVELSTPYCVRRHEKRAGPRPRATSDANLKREPPRGARGRAKRAGSGDPAARV